MLCACFCRGKGGRCCCGGGRAELFWWNVWVVPRKVSSLPLAKPSAPLRWGTTARVCVWVWVGGWLGGWTCLHQAAYMYTVHPSHDCVTHLSESRGIKQPHQQYRPVWKPQSGLMSFHPSEVDQKNGVPMGLLAKCFGFPD